MLTGQYLMVPVHVDNMIPTGKPQSVITAFMDDLEKEFKIKRLGPTAWFSGIRIERTSDHTYMMMPYYLNDLLTKWEIQDDNPSSTPMKAGENMYALTHQDTDPKYHNSTEVLSLASSWGWAVETVRPDMMYARMMMSRMQQKCTESSWKLMKNSLRYIIDTKWYGIRYTKGTAYPNTLITFVDTSLGTCKLTGRAAYCIIIFING